MIMFFLAVRLFVLMMIGVFFLCRYVSVGFILVKFWYFVVGILWWVRKFLVNVFEFFSWVVFVVGLKIFSLAVWKVLIMFFISGVFGLMMVRLIFLFCVKFNSVGILVMLIVMFCSVGFSVVFVLFGVIKIVLISGDWVVF